MGKRIPRRLRARTLVVVLALAAAAAAMTPAAAAEREFQPAGELRIDFLGIGDDHYEIVNIVSTRSGTPTTEHHVKVR